MAPQSPARLSLSNTISNRDQQPVGEVRMQLGLWPVQVMPSVLMNSQSSSAKGSWLQGPSVTGLRL